MSSLQNTSCTVWEQVCFLLVFYPNILQFKERVHDLHRSTIHGTTHSIAEIPLLPAGVFNTTGASHSGQNSSTINGGEVISLRPNKQRTKKSRNLVGRCG